MANAVTARWHGDDYQARIFWEHALLLLDPSSCVAEVTFEADDPKAFDDIVVRYDPPVPRSGPERVCTEHYQIKWHVDSSWRFGYEDLVEPEFIGASSTSLLQRLHQARAKAPPQSGFVLLTTARVKDGDPLGKLVFQHDRALLLERLFDGTTDRSKMGAVRKLWREHLGLSCDEDLRPLLTGLRIMEGYRSLDELRDQVDFKARAVGVLPSPASQSDFRFDALARQLKVRGINTLDRTRLETFCRDEGLLCREPMPADPFRPIAIRSFLGPSADLAGASPEDTLLLSNEFRQRYLRHDLDWQRDIRPKVDTFLRSCVPKSSKLCLILDAHASIALLAGSVLHTKSGVEIELVQKGRVGARTWRADDGCTGERLGMILVPAGSQGEEIACAVSISQPTEDQVVDYVTAHLPNVKTIAAFRLPPGPGQRTVAGGEHAAALAEQIASAIRELKAQAPDAVVHLFAACPNSVLFYLGQQHQSLAPCIVYEYDFDRQDNKSYQPAFTLG